MEFHQESSTHHEEAPELIKDIYTQIAVCFEKLGAPFETPFVQGKSEVEKLVQLLHNLQKEDTTSIQTFVNYGRKSEWEKWYSRVIKLLG